MTQEASIIIEYKNKRPLELLDLTNSLSALGNQFKRFVSDENGIDSETRLFVHEVRTGSTITELIALGQKAADLYDAYEKVKDFAGSFYAVLQSILHLTTEAKELDRSTIKNAASFVAPLAIDGDGARINMIDNRGGDDHQSLHRDANGGVRDQP